MNFPKMIKIRQRFTGPVVADIDGTVSKQLDSAGLKQNVKPGMQVAITAGSRGIANIQLIIRAVVRELRQMGAEPFIVPTMGSHGGATAKGQVEVLESLGITEAFCGAPIRSSMEVEQIGQTEEGMPLRGQERSGSGRDHPDGAGKGAYRFQIADRH